MSTKSQMEQLADDLKSGMGGAPNGPAPDNIVKMAKTLLAKATKEKDADLDTLKAIDLDTEMITNGMVALLMNQAAMAIPDPPIAIG